MVHTVPAMSITPTEITNHNRSESELQSFWLFAAFCAGKNSDYAAACLTRLLNKCGDLTPFEYLSSLGETNVHNALVAARIGQYSRLTRFIMESVKLDLRTATLADLMGVFGVGPKTARFFLVHSRHDTEHAILDTHILKYLRSHGVETGSQTPTSMATYLKLEKIFLSIARAEFPNMSIAAIDLLLWMKYSGRLENDSVERNIFAEI
jgi:endonuclease III